MKENKKNVLDFNLLEFCKKIIFINSSSFFLHYIIIIIIIIIYATFDG
jgi:hypothetical protein